MKENMKEEIKETENNVNTLFEQLFEELPAGSQEVADASCGGGICSACRCNFSTPW